MARQNPWRRAASLLIDLVVALALTMLLASTSGRFFAERAVATLHIYDPDSLWKGPVPMVLGAVSTLSYGFAFAALLVLAAEPLTGRTPGRLATGGLVTDIAGRPADGRRLWRRHAIKTSGFWLFCLALLVARWEILVLAAAVLLVTAVGWLGTLLPSRRALHDRLSATEVRRP